MSVLMVANARKAFGSVVALDGASLELRRGELLALLGPNGAGKTTLIRAVAGRVRRLLSTRIGMSGLLAGRWVFIALLGVAQLTVMFIWGRVAFGPPLFSHLPGFFVMTAVTAAAAAALGLLLASVARTRGQLSGFSTILVLTMSALGGSMFPRFLMSETMQRMGLLTFNAWALDGYLKVFCATLRCGSSGRRSSCSPASRPSSLLSRVCSLGGGRRRK